MEEQLIDKSFMDNQFPDRATLLKVSEWANWCRLQHVTHVRVPHIVVRRTYKYEKDGS